MRHRYGLLYSLFWVTFPRSHVIDRSKVADVVCCCYINPNLFRWAARRKLRLLLRLRLLLGEQKTIEARKQGRQKPAVCGTQKPSKNTGQYLQGCKTFDFTFLLFLSLFVNFLYKLGFVWVIPTSKWFEFTYFCKIGLGN